jgi:hypothetical protein
VSLSVHAQPPSSGGTIEEMIDRLRAISRTISFLSLPAIILGIACLGYAVFIVFSSDSHQGDKYLFPSIGGFLWSLSAYGLIETFKHVPSALADNAGFFKRLRHNFSRLWYWLIALIFVGTTIGILVITARILSIWLRDYGSG